LQFLVPKPQKALQHSFYKPSSVKIATFSDIFKATLKAETYTTFWKFQWEKFCKFKIRFAFAYIIIVRYYGEKAINIHDFAFK